MDMKRLIMLAALVLAFPALGAEALTASVEGLARASDVVAQGRVRRVTTQLSNDGARVFTHVEVDTGSVWRGTAPPKLTIIVPGGEVGRIGQRVDGAASFDPGEVVVVFLGRAEAGAYRVTGMAQGKFSVVGGTARPDLAGLRRMPAQPRPGERVAEPMSVDELERRVRSTP